MHPLSFIKYHGLGNDYLVLDGAQESLPTPETVRRICDRHYGIGSDGILLMDGHQDGHIRLRILNPDGSEAEKSGNGIRIFARYLWDKGIVQNAPFHLSTKGGVVQCQILDDGKNIRVRMGKASFLSRDIPVNVSANEAIGIPVDIDGRTLHFNAVSMGNPHCVIFDAGADAETARRLGPLIEHHPLFPNRTNVQFAEILDRRNIRIEIWERGAGYTLASGSSSCAAASMAHKLGYCDPSIKVHMPSGIISIDIDKDMLVTMTGPVVRVGAVTLDPQCFD